MGFEFKQGPEIRLASWWAGCALALFRHEESGLQPRLTKLMFSLCNRVCTFPGKANRFFKEFVCLVFRNQRKDRQYLRIV